MRVGLDVQEVGWVSEVDEGMRLSVCLGFIVQLKGSFFRIHAQ